MKSKSIKRWSLIALIILIAISVVSCIGVQSQINQHLGKKTERVNPSILKMPLSLLAIKNVSVLSTNSESMRDSLTILIKDGTIESVGKGIVISSEYKIIDGTDKYLIPGLIDTHVHLKKSKNDLLLYIANGVTSVCEMTGTKKHLEWSKEAKNGALSPYIFVASNKMGSTPGLIRKFKSWFAGRKNYTTENKARKAVQSYKEQGYDAIKLSSFLNPTIYKVIVDEAKKQNIPTIGHLSLNVGLKSFYSSGQSQLAHVEEIIKNTMEDYTGIVYDTPEDYLNYFEKNKDSIAIKIKKNNIAVTSTLWISESFPKQKFDLVNFIKTIELEYVNPGLVEGSTMSKGYLPGNNSYEDLEIKNDSIGIIKNKKFWNTYANAIQIMTKTLIENNVNLITGTDANVTCVVPGFSLHDELESLSKIGLSNTQILNAATLAPAKWMQINAGKIEVGHRADLVLLTKNPLDDIKNTRTINSVISNGKFLDRKTLDSILKLIKDANNKSRKVSINEFIN